MTAEDQVAVLFAATLGYLDDMLTSQIGEFEKLFLETLKSRHPHILQTIAK